MVMKKPQPPRLRRLLPVIQVMEALGFSESKVRTLISDGELPGYQFASGAIRVDQADLDAYINRARILPGGKAVIDISEPPEPRVDPVTCAGTGQEADEATIGKPKPHPIEHTIAGQRVLCDTATGDFVGDPDDLGDGTA